MKNNSENILMEALKLQEQGRSVQEILNLYPENKNELQEMFETIDFLNKEKNKIEPSKEVLEKIIDQISSEKYVTNEEINRCSYRKGRLINLSQIHNIMNWKLIVPIGVVAVLAVFLISQYGGSAPQYVQNIISPATPAEKIDDVVDNIMAELVSENTVFAEEDGDALLVQMDSQELSDFGQSYNENEY
ncbi:MAG: hypothetical protein PHP03_00995 [Candidatus Pacebacteria bacterium]|nr:hypothetical protein [Candidatus Paceibacterota bacterium]